MAGAKAPAASRRSIPWASSFCLQHLPIFQARTSSKPGFSNYFFQHLPIIALVGDQLSAFSAGAVPFVVISFPLSHMENRSPKNLVFVLSCMPNFFLPCLRSQHPFSAMWAELCCWENIAGSFEGRRIRAQRRGWISTWAALTLHPETERKFTKPVLQWLPGNQWNDPKLKFSSSWLMANILKAAGLWGFFPPPQLFQHMKLFPFPGMSKRIITIHWHTVKRNNVSNIWINAYVCAKGAPRATAFVSTNLLGQIPDCRSSR